MSCAAFVYVCWRSSTISTITTMWPHNDNHYNSFRFFFLCLSRFSSNRIKFILVVLRFKCNQITKFLVTYTSKCWLLSRWKRVTESSMLLPLLLCYFIFFLPSTYIITVKAKVNETSTIDVEHVLALYTIYDIIRVSFVLAFVISSLLN